ncbi:MAG TPA: hypothetical protein ENI97_09105 [Gammaproteobacteria bacterium]|nr:hypothetical protein [Gammaproteobacteria bacterium]
MGADTKTSLLHRQIADGLSIEVHETDGLRWLDFGDGGIQSIIAPAQPERLVSPHNQAILAGLLFVPTPRNILLLGTGGGALARFFAHHVPGCKGVAVERSAAVIHIARQFFDFPDLASRWRLHLGDARHFVEHTPGRYDLVILDIAQGQHTPAWVTDSNFLSHCHQRLAHTAVFVVNLIPHHDDEFAQQLGRLRQAFPDATACLSVPEHHNVLVFGFQDPFTVEEAEARLPALSRQWPVPFAEAFQRLREQNPPGSGIF